MQASTVPDAAKPAIFTLAEIKAVTEAFDRGEHNVFDALEAITLVLEAHAAATRRLRPVA